MNENRNKKILALALLLPVILGALLLAPCLGKGNIFTVLSLFSSAWKTPFRITWSPYSLRCLVLFICLYGAAVLILFGTGTVKRPGVEHGSARWGSAEMLNSMLMQGNNIPLTRHVSIGLDTHRHRRNLNILAIGGSGAGKTRGLALPGILECEKDKAGSYSLVITDPKGEILEQTGSYLSDQGYTIRVLNLVDPSSSEFYNPFRYIRTDTDVLKLVTNLIKNTTPKGASTGDPFWEKAETALLEAIIFYLLESVRPEDQNFGSVMDLLELFDIDEENDKKDSRLDQLFHAFEQDFGNHIAVRQFKVFRQATGKGTLGTC